ncbi:PucR family transcriptional regulator ligand-binding domain-containing protein [Streptomyces sp. NPDC047009]|uniref:helix-turn-helix domain-containing protein n=1 Tax=Streptomyces sp. NPDC047009 TaxID=3154496 RepID=UPI0033F4C109
MPLHLADLVARSELHLSVVAAPDRLDRPVEAAHASELLRPGQWLQGGELLMTIGLLLPMTEEACRAYVQDCAAAGAGALVLGLGRELPYQEAPAPLIAAAEAAGLPLLTVPDEVPFIAVTKAVFAAKAAEQHRALERVFDAQRRLTAAAASGRGLTATLEAWVDATGIAAAVTDLLGRPIAAAGLDDLDPFGPAGLPPAVTELVHKVAGRGLRGSASSASGSLGSVEVQPLGANRLRGLLVLVGTLAPNDRMPASGLVSLLSLELERRHLADEPERRRRSALLGRLLTEGVSAEHAHDVLAVAGLASDTVRTVAVDPSGTSAEMAAEVAADLALAVPGGLVRVHDGLVEAVVGDNLDLIEILSRFASGAPAGIGPAVPPEAATGSLRQARALVAVSRALGHPAQTREAHSARLLLEFGDRRALRGYADAVLGPLDSADPTGDLVRTLATWLDTGGSWDETSRRLAVHRHTARNRIDKAMRLTGRNLDDGDDRFDLWLATRIRQEMKAPGT